MKPLYLYVYTKRYFNGVELSNAPLLSIQRAVRELKWQFWMSIPIDTTPSGEIYYIDLIYSK